MAWLVVGPSLWKIWVRQLGWWHSQLIWENKTCSKAPTSCISFLNTSKEMIQTLLGGWGKTLWKICLFVMESYISQLVLGKKEKHEICGRWDLVNKEVPEVLPVTCAFLWQVRTELLRVADFWKFCGHNGRPQDGSNQVGRLCQLAGLVHQQTLISFMIYTVGPRDDSSVGEHNYSTVCVFFGRCNYTVDRWDYKRTYK